MSVFYAIIREHDEKLVITDIMGYNQSLGVDFMMSQSIIPTKHYWEITREI